MHVSNSLEEWGFTPIKALAKSSCRKIYLATSGAYERAMVLKVLPKDSEVNALLHSEIRSLSLLQHQHIIQLQGFYESAREVGVVTPYLNTLLLHLQRAGPLGEVEARPLFRQLTLAVHHMHHTVRITHGLISKSSVLLDQQLNVKLTDFSLSVQFKSGLSWSSPAVKDNVQYDLYCMGQVLEDLLVEDVSAHCKHILEQLSWPFALKNESFTTTDILDHDWLSSSSSLALEPTTPKFRQHVHAIAQNCEASG